MQRIMVAPPRLFIHYLERLKNLLKQVEHFDHSVINGRLHPDMFPLLEQARTAIGFALRSTCPLAGRQIVSFSDNNNSLSSIYAELEATISYLSEIPNTDFEHIESKRVETTAGFAELTLSGWDYYLMYSVPNFFFHYCMVYAIARQAGVPIGKADFDGFHQYPAGFVFPDDGQ